MARDQRYELVKGHLLTMTPSGFDHGAVVVNVTVPLASYVKSQKLRVVVGAETGFKLASRPDTVRAPDIAFIRRERLASSGRPTTFWVGAPDLAIEVTLAIRRDSRRRRGDRHMARGGSGVRVGRRSDGPIAVHRAGALPRVLTENETVDGEDVIPGFTFTVVVTPTIHPLSPVRRQRIGSVRGICALT